MIKHIRSRNSITPMIALVAVIAFSSATVINAKTPIETQAYQVDNLNKLKYQLEKIRLEAQVAQVTKECKLNNGCSSGSTIVPIIKTIASGKKTENEKKLNDGNNIKGLFILAIVNKTVFFKNYNNSFKEGDTLIPGIKIQQITNSSVTLISTNSDIQIQKTINIDWIMD